ncbi:MAG: hypothetical protein ACXAE3_02515 [Candidatus Kariarchaeaceae archaeon]|jgi:DNA-binding NarL/FixJ family response regulator
MLEADIDEAEINDILIVGNSESSFDFSLSLQEIRSFTRVVHVIKAVDAVKLLTQEQFSIVIIDEDASDVNSVTLSRLIRDNLPLTRIVIISSHYDNDFIRDLINVGSVDALIPIPIDSFSASSIILEQYAKFQINSQLYNLVTKDPPKFSPSYYMFHDPSLDQHSTEDLEFLGMVVIYASMTKFAKFYSDSFRVDEYLITGYISAISLLGEQLFEEDSFFREINFGGLSVVMHTEGDIQFMFFFKELSKQSYQTIENEINRVIKRMNIHYFDFLRSEKPTPDEIDEEIEIIADYFSKTHKKIVDFSRKLNVVYYGAQSESVNRLLRSDLEKYNFQRFTRSTEVIDYLLNYEVDILILDQLDEFESSLVLANQAKDIKPEIQTMASLRQFNSQNLMRSLNDDFIDYVFDIDDTAEEVEKLIDDAFQQSLKIRTQLLGTQPDNSENSLHRSVVTRSMLRSNDSAYRISKIPEFYGIFIMNDDFPYFRKLWPNSAGRTINFDEQLFAGFVSSMEMFSAELFESEEDFSGFKFGDITILIRQKFSFNFVYFLANVDHTNFAMIEKQLAHSSDIIHEAIMNSEGFYVYDIKNAYDVSEVILYHVTELFMRLVSLNFFD